MLHYLLLIIYGHTTFFLFCMLLFCCFHCCYVENTESRSPTSWHEDDRPLSPSVAQGQTKNFQDSDDRPFLLNSPTQSIPISAAAYDAPKAGTPSNGNISNQYLNDASQSQSGYIKEQFETNFDVDGNVETETKSISSVKSGGSVVQENHR